MAKTPICCLFLSEPWCVSGSFHSLKGIPRVFSVEEGFDLAWEVLHWNIRAYHHIDSSNNQGKMDISQNSQTRVWKCHGCRGYSLQWSKTCPKASLFRKVTLDSQLNRFLLELLEKLPCATSCSLNPVSLHGFSNTKNACQSCSPLWRTLMEHEKSFIYFSDTSSSDTFHTIRVKLPLHKLSPQAFGSFEVQPLNQTHERIAAPGPLCSGKQPLTMSHLDFPVCMAHNHMCCLKLSEVSDGADSLDGIKSTPNGFSLEEKSDLVWEILLFHLGDKQHIASSYNQGKNPFTQTSPSSILKQIVCNMYSTQWKDTSPNTSMLSNATLAFFPYISPTTCRR